jgi:hypothetical protein
MSPLVHCVVSYDCAAADPEDHGHSADTYGLILGKARWGRGDHVIPGEVWTHKQGYAKILECRGE